MGCPESAYCRSYPGHRPYARIDMAEVRVLQTDPVRPMHQRLRRLDRPGKSGRVGTGARFAAMSGQMKPMPKL